MQVSRIQAFNKRVAYNLCKTYANQLGTGEGYFMLNPVIAVTINDFQMFNESQDVINKFVFKEETKDFVYKGAELELIFLELPKFQKKLDELNSLTDKWIYFLKEAARLDIIPESLGEVSEIERALNIANQANFSGEELEQFERRAVMLQDERGQINQAREEAREEGREEGKLELVMLLINQRFGEVDEVVSNQIFNLSGEDLESLVKAILDFNTLADLLSWLENL